MICERIEEIQNNKISIQCITFKFSFPNGWLRKMTILLCNKKLNKVINSASREYNSRC